MKNLLLVVLITGNAIAMESAEDITAKIATIIEEYDVSKKADDADFKGLVNSYFTRESIELESHLMPHFAQKLLASDTQIDELIKAQDKAKLELFISGLITESLEDAFKAQSDRFAELKALADTKLQKTRYALITAVITTILSLGGAAFMAWYK